MLTELTVRNLALIDSLSIVFGPGINIMTGETGAGKSVLAGALSLLMGRRGGAELVRAGAGEAEVSGLFRLDEPESLSPLLADWGLAPTRELLLRRVIGVSGRGRAYIGSAPATLAQLGQLAQELLSLSGQHEQQSLLQPGRLMAYLDNFGDCRRLLTLMASEYGLWSGCARELAALEEKMREGAEKRDFYEFQRDEINKVAPKPGEDEALAAEKKSARDGERLQETLSAALAVLSGEPGHVLERLGRARRSLETAAALDERLAESRVTAESCYHQLADLTGELEIFSRGLKMEPGRLDWVEERLSALAKLKRKYGLDLAGLMERSRQLTALLEDIDGAGLDLARLRRKKEEAQVRALAAAESLSAARRAAGGRLAEALTTALRPLGFPKMSMEVSVEAPSGGPEEELERLGPAGYDRADFLFAPNPGEGRASLSRIASGGELSRILLALKITANRPSDQLLVFDEIDAGLGGAAAEAVAESLARLAGRQQLIVITHLPRVAALAGRHFVVSKGPSIGGDRTATSIVALKTEERAGELARMLGGSSPSPEAAALAARMLGEADSSDAS